MAQPVMIVWDCGSTNVRAVAMDTSGKVLAEAKASNQTVSQPDGPPDWRIWDVDRIFSDLTALTARVAGKVPSGAIKGLAVTTWGAEAAPVDRDGNLVYPLISWQCSRTAPLMDWIKTKIDPREIFRLTGYQIMSFNTLLRLIWIRQNAPAVWGKTYKFLTITAILNHRLTGEFSVDPTMAGTSMAFNISRRRWENSLLALAGTDESIWPKMVEPGQAIGTVRPDLAGKMNLPAGLPVFAAGHDTQFALYGSGASADEAIVSSGTWEILSARIPRFEPDVQTCSSGILIEPDACGDLVDPQFLMMASGTLEWVRNRFYAGEPETGIYSKMTAEAQGVAAGSNGTVFLANFMPDSGPAAAYKTPGSIVGLNVNTTRAEVYRAAIEGLSCQLRNALEVFSQTLRFEPKAIRVVGGGSKNPLWNQIRADVTNLPVVTVTHSEATVLGAAMFAFVGLREFADINQARASIDVGEHRTMPSARRDEYEKIYQRYLRLIRTVGPVYHGQA